MLGVGTLQGTRFGAGSGRSVRRGRGLGLAEGRVGLSRASPAQARLSDGGLDGQEVVEQVLAKANCGPGQVGGNQVPCPGGHRSFSAQTVILWTLLRGVHTRDGVPCLNPSGQQHLPEAHRGQILTLSLPPGIGLMDESALCGRVGSELLPVVAPAQPWLACILEGQITPACAVQSFKRERVRGSTCALSCNFGGVATLPSPLGQREGYEEPLVGLSALWHHGSSCCSRPSQKPSPPSHRASGGSPWTRSTGRAASPGT